MPHGQWALPDSDTLVLIDRSACLVEPCTCACRTKRSSRSAHGQLREPHRGSLSSRLAVLAPVFIWLSIHSTIGGILMHLMQARHRFSVASRECARAAAAVCSQEEITSTLTLSWQTSQELVFVLLRHSQCLISQLMCQLDLHPRQHHRRRRQETCFSSSHDLVDHTRRAASCLLFFVSGRRVSTPACSIMPARRAGICFSQLPALSGIALPIKLCSSISRTIAVRRRRVRDGVIVFLTVSAHQEGRNVGHLSARSNVALASQNAGVVNGLRRAST